VLTHLLANSRRSERQLSKLSSHVSDLESNVDVSSKGVSSLARLMSSFKMTRINSTNSLSEFLDVPSTRRDIHSDNRDTDDEGEGNRTCSQVIKQLNIKCRSE
jgi:hypothetical protein